jgi:hypothetical protein
LAVFLTLTLLATTWCLIAGPALSTLLRSAGWAS